MAGLILILREIPANTKGAQSDENRRGLVLRVIVSEGRGLSQRVNNPQLINRILPISDVELIRLTPAVNTAALNLIMSCVFEEDRPQRLVRCAGAVQINAVAGKIQLNPVSAEGFAYALCEIPEECGRDRLAYELQVIQRSEVLKRLVRA